MVTSVLVKKMNTLQALHLLLGYQQCHLHTLHLLEKKALLASFLLFGYLVS